MKKYKHYKGGIYFAIAEVTHTETMERLVLYVNKSDIYKQWEDAKCWVRPYDMFHGLLEDGTKRFEEIG